LYVYLTEKAGFALSRNRKLPFIVGSPSTKAELVAKGFDPAMIEIINYCVDHTIHKRSNIQRSTKPLIGYFGRLKKYKSIEHLLRAVALVMKKVPDLELFIVGEGDNRKALESLTVQLGINQVVRFTGFVNEAEKVRLMQEVWFAVNTSSKEGWGLTVVEANACGTTVLASNVPGLRDAINDGETGLLYEYGNIDELSKKILTLIGDSSLRNRLAQAAHTWALTFDWDQAAQRTMELLQNHVNQSSKMLS
ncbi:MAG TPA: glycosyltransferase family 4 protein, partial [Bacteroidota bacterium]|nr:glycosyltransferase family 4 protein [Bacteroidota bacterium]